MNRFVKTSRILFTTLGITQTIFAADTNKASLHIKAEASMANVGITLKDNFIKGKYASAENRFIQGNVKASYNDYSELISKVAHDDYVFLSYAIKMTEYGFFDLTEQLLSKSSDMFRYLHL